MTTERREVIVIHVRRLRSAVDDTEYLNADDVYLTLEAYASSLIDVTDKHPDYAFRRRIADEMFAMADHLRSAP